MNEVRRDNIQIMLLDHDSVIILIEKTLRVNVRAIAIDLVSLNDSRAPSRTFCKQKAFVGFDCFLLSNVA